jgi:hypothetical protein
MAFLFPNPANKHLAKNDLTNNAEFFFFTPKAIRSSLSFGDVYSATNFTIKLVQSGMQQ